MICGRVRVCVASMIHEWAWVVQDQSRYVAQTRWIRTTSLLICTDLVFVLFLTLELLLHMRDN